ncbi:MAG: hypothetical protein A3E25_11825 [Burkholderiales bacterium RIFCSPHIGHO2_12_FULL_69_20]|nr:MAG: hypothetical protein A3E25_11825 [Burkholderiales bacterium RIFCSPHIGHO2_12_FULL_69_20]
MPAPLACVIAISLLGSVGLVSMPLGIDTALAVIAHEVPQEAGNFAILRDSGFSRSKAFLQLALRRPASSPSR